MLTIEENWCTSSMIASKLLRVIPDVNFSLCITGDEESTWDQIGHLGDSSKKGYCLTLESISMSYCLSWKCLKPDFHLSKRHYTLKEYVCTFIQKIESPTDYFTEDIVGTFLVVQWLRLYLSMQMVWV